MPAVSLNTPSGEIGGWRADPMGKSRGGVVVAHEIYGFNPNIRGLIDRLAAHGFSAIAPVFFDHFEPGLALGYDAQDTARGRELAMKVGFERALEDVAVAAEALRDRVEHVGVLGFSWGGTVAFLANTRLEMPAVVYYGSRTLPFLHEAPKAHLMLHFGAHDPLIDAEALQAHRNALPDAVIRVWNAGHGFNCDDRADYDEASAHHAFRHTRRFFRWVLGS
ncbi:MAG: dienelactone hydrolase family protein [Xanthomonadales bacterium]|nr:dienelactone hydrolase family protein [Xanthomonadales bacterium]